MANATSEDGPDNVALARRIFERGNDSLRSSADKESRAMLLEAWRDFENEKGDDESRKKIVEKMPRRIKRRRRVAGEDGVSSSRNFYFFFLELIGEDFDNNILFMFFCRRTMDGKRCLTLSFPKTSHSVQILSSWRTLRPG